MNNLRGAKIIYQESKATQPSHLYFLQKDANYCEIIVTSESGVKRKLNLIIDLSNYYTKNETDLLLENYYLKSEIDTFNHNTYLYINQKISDHDAQIQTKFLDYYNKIDIDALLYSSYYTKSETYSQNEIDDFLDLKADFSSLGNYYTKSETYSKTEINGFLSGKQNTIGYTPENVANKSDSYTASSSTTYASTKALVDGLSTKIDKGGYTGTAQDLKDDIDTKQKKLSSFDESILIETDGNIEGNVSLFTEYFNQQVCELNFIPTQIIGVYQDGIKLLNSEYEIILPKKIKIKEYVDENIQIEYTHLKS